MVFNIKINNLFKSFLFIFLFAIAFCNFNTTPVSAEGEGWIGSGTAGGGGGGWTGGGGGASCSADDKKYRLDCAGVSWIFYETQNTSNTKDVHFDTYGDSINATIPAVCSQHEGGGFWHFGANLFGTKLTWTYGGWYGHWKTLNWGYAPWDKNPLSNGGKWAFYSTKTNDLLSSKGQTVGGVYKATKYGTYNDVYQAFKEAYQGINHTAWDKNYLPNDLYSFCWYPGMNNGFEAKATAMGNSANITTDWQSTNTYKEQSINCSDPNGCTVTFELELRRTSGNEITKYYLHKGDARLNTAAFEGPLVSPANGSSIKRTFQETILPGKNACYAIQFSPTGKDADIQTYEKVCVTAVDKNSSFQGIASASGSGVSISTEYQSTNNFKSATFTCKNSWGCPVTFTLGLRRTKGTGTTTYSYETGHDRNLMTMVPGSQGTGASASRSFTVYIKSEQTTCYDIKFSPTGNNNDWTWEKVCVTAQKEPTPEPCPGSGFLDMKVKNDNVANTWKTTEYAKPGDTLSYCAYYDPAQTQGPNGYNYSSYDCAGSCSNFTTPIGVALNLTNATQVNRNIKFNTETGTLGSFGGTYLNSFSYTRGNTDKHSEFNSYKVSMSNTGDVIDEQVHTINNTPTSTAWTTQTTTPRSYSVCGHDPYDCDPYDCNCTSCNCDDEGKNCEKCCDTCYHTCYEHYEVGHISTATAYSPVAHGHVPYNFINSTNIETSESTILYAGESKTFDLTLTVSPKTNPTTTGNYNDTYATQVHNAKWKLRVYYNGIAYDTNETTGEMLNMNESQLSTGSTVNRQKNIVVPDVPAGTRICVQSLVYPANSGSNTNWSDQGGSHTWAVSSQKCYTVAKRPSIQFWGGNIYSGMSINTTDSTAVKYHIAGNTYYSDLQRYSTAQVFGSWADQATIATGEIKGLASGAAMGYILGNTESKPGSFCNRISLSFANTNTLSLLTSYCSTTGQLSSLATADSNKNTLKDKYIYNTKTISASTLTTFNNTASGDTYKNNDIYYYDRQGDLTIGTNTASTILVPKNTTQVVHGRTLTINANLVYGNYNDTFTSLANMPKLVIYADQEVKIKCGVKRIDAVIVAKKVTTCSDGTTAKTNSDRTNSNQLFVNGTIITSNLVANRTYGAAIGQNSSVAAEIINYDPSLYYWSTNSVSKNDSGDNADLDLSTTYQKELAPRF